jgi:hypothetical protein
MTKHQPHQYPSPEAIVKAALEKIAKRCDDNCEHMEAEEIRRIADDPADVAAIIEKAGEDRG